MCVKQELYFFHQTMYVYIYLLLSLSYIYRVHTSWGRKAHKPEALKGVEKERELRPGLEASPRSLHSDKLQPCECSGSLTE